MSHCSAVKLLLSIDEGNRLKLTFDGTDTDEIRLLIVSIDSELSVPVFIQILRKICFAVPRYKLCMGSIASILMGSK